MDEVEVHYITDEEYAAAKARLIAQLKAIPDWQSKLARCHIKCSDIDSQLRYALWMTLDCDEVIALYKEAGIDGS